MKKTIKLMHGTNVLASTQADVSKPADFRKAVNKMRAQAERVHGDVAWYAEIKGGKAPREAAKPAIVTASVGRAEGRVDPRLGVDLSKVFS